MMPTHDIQGPQMRATQLQEAFKWVDALDPLPRDAIKNRCAREHITEVMTAHRLVWVPLEYGVELTEAVQAVLGERGSITFGRESFHQAADRVWVRPILQAALRIFRRSPRGVYRFMPRFWDGVFRNAGKISFIERGDRAGTILLSDFPPLVRTPSHLTALSGSFAAALDFCQVRGEVKRLPMAPDATECAFDVAWEASKSAQAQLR